MNRTRNLVLVTAACMSTVFGFSKNAPVQSTFIGSLADWQATPVPTTGDKQFTYLTNTGSWSGAELFTLSANIPLGSYTLGLDGLSAYVGPYTLSFGYELLITDSTQYFQSMALDVIASANPEVAGHGEEAGMLAGAVVVERGGLGADACQGTGARLVEGPVGPALEGLWLEPRLGEHAPGRPYLERRAGVGTARKCELGRREAELVHRTAL